MKKSMQIALGIAFICLGVLVLLNLLNILKFNLLFDGWWALFIIVPCTIGLFNDKCKTGPLMGIGIGVLLLLSAQGVIDWCDIWKFMLGFAIIALGLGLIIGKEGCGSRCSKQTADEIKTIDRGGRQIKEMECSMGKQTATFAGQKFEGADIKCSFGAAELDLRGADILDGSIITVNCSFAGVEIHVDPTVVVKIAANSSFGGVNDSRHTVVSDATKTIYLEGTCAFGGIQVR